MNASPLMATQTTLRAAEFDPRIGGDERRNARIENVAKDFEAVFIAQMLEPLFASLETPAIAGGGKSEAFFKSLLQETYAKSMADRGGFGVATHVKSALMKLQSAGQETLK